MLTQNQSTIVFSAIGCAIAHVTIKLGGWAFDSAMKAYNNRQTQPTAPAQPQAKAA